MMGQPSTREVARLSLVAAYLEACGKAWAGRRLVPASCPPLRSITAAGRTAVGLLARPRLAIAKPRCARFARVALWGVTPAARGRHARAAAGHRGKVHGVSGHTDRLACGRAG